VSISETSITKLVCETKTGEEFNKIIIALLQTTSGYYDVLFYNDGDQFAVPYGEEVEAVRAIEQMFDKRFECLQLDESKCWGFQLS
jgi:hypothetical protein